MAKLRSELDTVNGNVQVFREMLSELAPGHESEDDLGLLRQLHVTCREMQKRIVQLLQTITNEQVTSKCFFAQNCGCLLFIGIYANLLFIHLHGSKFA
jgi:hypothetical protein